MIPKSDLGQQPEETFEQAGRGRRRIAWAMAMALPHLALSLAVQATDAPATIEQGRRIYQDGVLPSGTTLKGGRLDTTPVEGADAACVRCHRRSGMGGVEGNIIVPPVTGRFLFATDERPIALLDTRSPRDITQAHAPYTDESLMRAIAAGSNIHGQAMSPLMPRYGLAEGDLAPLVAYLKQLSNTLSPGVTDTSVRFATIIAPGVDVKRRDLMLQMIRDAFRQRNYSQSPRSGQMRSPLESIPHQRRNWELAVWELTGAPETWAAQLAEHYAREPAFAVVSGLSSGTWTPVHRFCEEQRLPCLFPSVDLPADTESFYSLYFTRGVALEAAVLAKHLGEAKKPPRRVLQVHRDEPVGNAAAAALASALADAGIRVEDRILDPAKPIAASRDLGTGDEAAVLWLRKADLALLAKASPKPPGAAVYLSARMAGDDLKAYPQTWKPAVQVIYPYAIGEEREKNVRVLKGWLQTYGLPLVDESFQSEVFFNLLLLTDVTTQVLDNYYRDYFVERTEDMLGQFVDRAQSAQSMLGQGANVSAYPRLSLGAGQRFASKGAYIARFDKHGTLVAQTDWIVP